MNLHTVGLFRLRLCTLGTHYHPTLDPAVLWTPSYDTSRPISSDSLNLMPPAPLYLRTLWHYTNAVIIIIIIIKIQAGKLRGYRNPILSCEKETIFLDLVGRTLRSVDIVAL